MVDLKPDLMKIQLFISCRKLMDVETFSKSDPFVEVHYRTRETESVKLGQTEVIWDNLNPDYVKSFILDYYFEEQQYLEFKVFDANMEQNQEVKGLAIGQAECTVGEIIGSKGQQVVKTLTLPDKKKSTGNIILRIEEVNENDNNEVLISFSGKGLAGQGTWCGCHKFSPMFYLSRVMESGANQRVYVSDFENGNNVNWGPMAKSVQELCNGDLNRPISFELYDHYSSSRHRFIGSFEFSIIKISEGGEKKFEITHPKNNKQSLGSVIVSDFQLLQKHSFLEFIAGGLQINLVIGVDFTSSNGNPLDPSSLHYISPNVPNQYQAALQSVSEILLNYDSDKEVPLFGFGGRIDKEVDHCFALNSNISNPSVKELKGIMKAYKEIITTVKLDGPTYFAPLLETVVKMAEFAKVNQSNQQYFILLILTDGDIHDMQQTIDLIVRGSESPLSITIVGIGKSSFEKMVELDADVKPLINSDGKKMTRDIVQFVPYEKFKHSVHQLTKQVLEEIPREIVNFFKIRGIIPNAQVRNEFDFKRVESIRVSAPDIIYDEPERIHLIQDHARRNPSGHSDYT